MRFPVRSPTRGYTQKKMKDNYPSWTSIKRIRIGHTRRDRPINPLSHNSYRPKGSFLLLLFRCLVQSLLCFYSIISGLVVIISQVARHNPTFGHFRGVAHTYLSYLPNLYIQNPRLENIELKRPTITNNTPITKQYI